MATTFRILFNNLPINKLWIVKNPENWKDWKRGVMECTNIVTCDNDTPQGLYGLQIKDIEPYINGDFDVDPEYDFDRTVVVDHIGGFYCFSNKEDADLFFNDLQTDFI